MTWQPIATWVKSTDLVDVLTAHYNITGTLIYKRYVNIWHDGSGFVCGLNYLRGVTHWMPLPPPPAEQE